MSDLAAARPKLSAQTIAVRYVAFALVSAALNFAAQEAVVQFAPDAPLMLSILVGTAVGFAAKYLLDKRWIFGDRYTGGRDETRKVMVYGLFSVFTTGLFWGAELACWWAFGTDAAKYTGGAIALALGYWLKYRMDRRWVFSGARG